MKKRMFLLMAAFIVLVSIKVSAQDQDFTLVNKTGVTIHHVYITPHSSDTWGEDILGSDVFLDGEETDITFHPLEDVCLWDLKIDDKDGNSITWDSINLCKWTTVTLYWDGKKATATFDE